WWCADDPSTGCPFEKARTPQTPVRTDPSIPQDRVRARANRSASLRTRGFLRYLRTVGVPRPERFLSFDREPVSALRRRGERHVQHLRVALHRVRRRE